MNPDIVEEVTPVEIRAEMKLWAAVMALGLKDYHAKDRSAVHWFWSEDNHVGSFVWVCDLFKIDPDYARNRAQNAA
jgi:hypothetical protein